MRGAIGSIPTLPPPAFIIPKCERTVASYTQDGASTSEEQKIRTLVGNRRSTTQSPPARHHGTERVALLQLEAAPLMEARAVTGTGHAPVMTHNSGRGHRPGRHRSARGVAQHGVRAAGRVDETHAQRRAHTHTSPTLPCRQLRSVQGLAFSV